MSTDPTSGSISLPVHCYSGGGLWYFWPAGGTPQRVSQQHGHKLGSARHGLQQRVRHEAGITSVVEVEAFRVFQQVMVLFLTSAEAIMAGRPLLEAGRTTSAADSSLQPFGLHLLASAKRGLESAPRGGGHVGRWGMHSRRAAAAFCSVQAWPSSAEAIMAGRPLLRGRRTWSNDFRGSLRPRTFGLHLLAYAKWTWGMPPRRAAAACSSVQAWPNQRVTHLPATRVFVAPARQIGCVNNSSSATRAARQPL